MSIDTRQNRPPPPQEENLGTETGDHPEHGRRNAGDTRFARGNSAGYPQYSPYYTPPEEEGFNFEAEGFIAPDETLNPDGETPNFGP